MQDYLNFPQHWQIYEFVLQTSVFDLGIGESSVTTAGFKSRSTATLSIAISLKKSIISFPVASVLFKPSTVKSQQSKANSQQPTVNSQQSTVNSQQSTSFRCNRN
ncbi:MAG: hypothetical protein WCD53_16935 [Microcoleus sp.]